MFYVLQRKLNHHRLISKHFNTRRYRYEARNSALFEFLDNIKNRAHERPGWALANKLLRNTYLFRNTYVVNGPGADTPGGSSQPITPPAGKGERVPSWKKDTNEWSMELAQWCGVQIQEARTAIQLFPGIDNITLSPNVVAALEKVPYANSEEEYTEQFRRVDEKLGQELDSNVYIFAKRLYEICSLKKMETHVDDLLSIILVLGEFYRSPLSFRHSFSIVVCSCSNNNSHSGKNQS